MEMSVNPEDGLVTIMFASHHSCLITVKFTSNCVGQCGVPELPCTVARVKTTVLRVAIKHVVVAGENRG